MKSVYVTFDFPELGIKLLKENGFLVEVNKSSQTPQKNQLKRIFSNFDAVVTSINDNIDDNILSIKKCKLKLIANYAVGWDNIDLLTAKRFGVTVCNTPSAAGESVAEHAFMLLLACAKNLIKLDKYVRLGKYKRWEANTFLSSHVWGKNLGIVGLGNTGTFVAQIAYGGFRMKIFYYDQNRFEDFELLTEAKYYSLDHLLKESDFVSIHLPLTSKTKHLIGKEELRVMKKTAILINTSRGEIIDEEFLISTLKEKNIAGAGLDVFENEFNISHKLTLLDNVILTPHIGSYAVEARVNMEVQAVKNLIEGLKNA